jgi:hypothetical protein
MRMAAAAVFHADVKKRVGWVQLALSFVTALVSAIMPVTHVGRSAPSGVDPAGTGRTTKQKQSYRNLPHSSSWTLPEGGNAPKSVSEYLELVVCRLYALFFLTSLEQLLPSLPDVSPHYLLELYAWLFVALDLNHTGSFPRPEVLAVGLSIELNAPPPGTVAAVCQTLRLLKTSSLFGLSLGFS